MFVIRTACREDVPAILRLLQGAGVREDGVDKHPERFWVMEEIGESPRIAGTIGMEVYGRAGLLRSFVVERGRWNPQMGVQFLLVALSAAREQGIDELYLAAPGSFPLFEAIGFSAADASELPEPIRRSEHLKEAERSGEIRVMRCLLSRVLAGDGGAAPSSLQRDPAEGDEKGDGSSGSRE